jgi:hypothetical protein
MRLLPDEVEEELMDASVIRQLGMERGDEKATLAQEDGLAVELCEHLDVRAGCRHARCPDEDASQRLTAVFELEIGLEARHLPSVCISAYREIDEPEVFAVEEDHPGARPEDRGAEAADGVPEAVDPDQAGDRRRFATGDYEAVEATQVVGLADLDGVRAQPPQHRCVLAKVSLHRENPDA